MYESYEQFDQGASASLSQMEMSELQQAEAYGEIPPALVPEFEQAAQEGFTPQEMGILEDQQATMASLPPAEAMQYETDVTSTEEQAAQDSMDATMQQAEDFDSYINNA